MAMFPIIPFISEYLWQNAVRPLDKNAEESVALHRYTIAEFKVEDLGYTKLTDYVREIFTMASKLRNENQIKVKQPLKTMYINGNEELLKQVFINLIDNAIKFSLDDGKIDVDIRCENEVFEFSITNYGYEISEDKQKKIFNKFFMIFFI